MEDDCKIPNYKLQNLHKSSIDIWWFMFLVHMSYMWRLHKQICHLQKHTKTYDINFVPVLHAMTFSNVNSLLLCLRKISWVWIILL
jgi:hypothetical protein